MCFEAGEDGLPYSFCVPSSWELGEIVHSDGSLDIVMNDGTGQLPFGFGKASGPVEPSGRLNHFQPLPDSFIDDAERRQFLTEIGFEPDAVRDLSVESLWVDGQPGSMYRLTVDPGEPESIARVIGVQAPVGGGAGIGMLFVWDPSRAGDDVILDVIATLRIDIELVDALI